MKKKTKKNKAKKKQKESLVIIGNNAYHISSFADKNNETLAIALITDAINISFSNPDESLDQFNRGLKIMPSFAPGYYSRGILKKRRKDYIGALEDFTKAIEYDLKNQDVYWQKGLCEEKLRLFKDAADDYTLALEFNDKEALLYSDRGVVYDSMGLHKPALEDYNKAILLDPTAYEPYCNRGILYSILDKEQEALKNYNKAIEIKPDFDWVFFNRGICYYKQRDYKKAKDDFLKTIEINPNISYAYSFLGAIELEEDKFKDALKFLDKALKINPYDIFSYFYRAKFFKKTLKTDSQKESLRKMILLQLQNNNAFIKGKRSFYLYRQITPQTLDILKNGYLWFSNPDKLNDPLDSRFYQKNVKDEQTKEVLDEIRIRSLSASYGENYNHLLWGYYADGSRGLVIEYEFSVEELIKNGFVINEVEYLEKLRPQNTPMEFVDYGRSFFTKTPHWNHEKEWRIVTLADKLKEGHKLYDFFKIKSITFGLETTKEDKQKVFELNLNCEFFEFICKDSLSGNFEIEKRKI